MTPLAATHDLPVSCFACLVHVAHCHIQLHDFIARLQIMRRYHIQGRDDYKKYSKLCGMVTRLVHFLKKLDASDPARIELTDQLLEK